MIKNEVIKDLKETISRLQQESTEKTDTIIDLSNNLKMAEFSLSLRNAALQKLLNNVDILITAISSEYKTREEMEAIKKQHLESTLSDIDYATICAKHNMAHFVLTTLCEKARGKSWHDWFRRKRRQ